MARFRKLQVEVDAERWFRNGDHPLDGPREVEGRIVRYWRQPGASGEVPCGTCGIRMHEHGWIDTLEGGHRVCPGDWIVTGVLGERYPVKDRVFWCTYEPAEAVE